jgi:hypothetical protein
MPALKRKSAPINLLPTDIGDATLWGRVLQWILGTFRFLVIVVELVVIIGFLSRFFLDSRNSDLTDEINQKKALLESYLSFENDFKRTQKRLDIFNSFAYTETPFSEYVTQITRNLSPDLQITRLIKNGNEITVLVSGKSESALLAYATRLKVEPLLTEISVISVESIENSTLVQATLKAGENETTEIQ